MIALAEPSAEICRLTEMLNELEATQLRVELAPLNPRLRNYTEGGMKRVVVEVPPRWYRLICRKHPSSRGVRRGKFDTKIKRQNVIMLLWRLSRAVPSRSKYAAEIRAVAGRVG